MKALIIREEQQRARYGESCADDQSTWKGKWRRVKMDGAKRYEQKYTKEGSPPRNIGRESWEILKTRKCAKTDAGKGRQDWIKVQNRSSERNRSGG